jgi:hypothetical protein
MDLVDTPLFADPGGLAEIVFAIGTAGKMLELAQYDHRFHVQHRLRDRSNGLLSRGKGVQATRKIDVVPKPVLRRLDALIRSRAQQVEAFRIDRGRAAGHHCSANAVGWASCDSKWMRASRFAGKVEDGCSARPVPAGHSQKTNGLPTLPNWKRHGDRFVCSEISVTIGLLRETHPKTEGWPLLQG